MSKIVRVLTTVLFTSLALVSTAQEPTFSAVLPADLEWAASPDVPVPGVQVAPGVGDPTQPELYTSFGKMAAGVRFPAHIHPDARLTTVVSGVMYYGVGEGFGETELKPYPAGSVVHTPAGTPHVMWAKDGETVMQETGYGPTGLEFISEPQ